MTEREKLACLRVLYLVASADEVLVPEEQEALSEAIREAQLGDVQLADLVAADIDLQAELSVLETERSRQLTYEAAVAIANVDDSCSPKEEELLRQIEATLGIDLEKRDVLGRLLSEVEDTVLPSHVAPVADPVRRQAEINEDTLKYAVLAAALGAFPIPGLAIATDLAVTLLQTKLVRDVGQYFGRDLDRKQAAELLGGASLGLGIRVALSNLAKLVPGYGSAMGAASAFVSTYALGTVATRYFELGGLGAEAMKSDFAKARIEAESRYAKERDAIDERREALAGPLAELKDQLEAGQLTRAEYDKKLEALR